MIDKPFIIFNFVKFTKFVPLYLKNDDTSRTLINKITKFFLQIQQLSIPRNNYALKSKSNEMNFFQRNSSESSKIKSLSYQCIQVCRYALGDWRMQGQLDIIKITETKVFYGEIWFNLVNIHRDLGTAHCHLGICASLNDLWNRIVLDNIHQSISAQIFASPVIPPVYFSWEICALALLIIWAYSS